jgi:LAO/AO transport system kinase
MPEAGDIIQTLKAGLMEIADIYVVNKADREGANQMVVAITSMLKMATAHGDWIPPVLATQANKNGGLPELYGDIQRHRDFLEQDSRLEQRRGARRGEEFLVTIEEELGRRLKELMARDMTLGNVLEEVKKGEREPYSSALKLLEDNLTILKDLASSPTGQ